MVTKHSVHRLYDERLARSTRPFLARGSKVERCEFCRIDQQHCICAQVPKAGSNAAFLILYYDDEILKPSNTGRLIADLFDDTFAYIWDRTHPNEEMLSLLLNPQWQPFVIFPPEHVNENRCFNASNVSFDSTKRPLFILLDGSWREARKMFRKSPYLDNFPILSISLDRASRYGVRKASHDHHLATAEVAAHVVDVYGEQVNAELLLNWFDFFSFRYQRGVKQTNKGDETAEARLAILAKKLI